MEYRKPRALFSIARGTGTTLSLGDCTVARSRGSFARILSLQIMVERKGFALVVNLEYFHNFMFCFVLFFLMLFSYESLMLS